VVLSVQQQAPPCRNDTSERAFLVCVAVVYAALVLLDCLSVHFSLRARFLQPHQDEVATLIYLRAIVMAVFLVRTPPPPLSLSLPLNNDAT
jgi:uncharacterized membrane protein